MKKKVGIIKRVTCLGLIFLLSINSFAAIVSDNDGSAFITKAEFDALKSSFQSQIDTYNQSIDSKIDGAIASYLSGIKVTRETYPRVLVPNVITMSGTSQDILYWSGRTDYVMNSNQQHTPKLVGLWNVFWYDTNSVATRSDAMVNEQLIGKRRDANKYVPIIWCQDDGTVSQVSNTQVILTFSAQLAYVDVSNKWGMPTDTFGMVDGWNNNLIIGKPIFAGNGHGPRVDPSDTDHYYANRWYSYVYLYNTSIDTDTTNPDIKFNVAPLGYTYDWIKEATKNTFDFYWVQDNVNTTARLRNDPYGSEGDLTTDYWDVDKYVGWSRTKVVNGVWSTQLRLWSQRRSGSMKWPFLMSIDSENQEIRKGVKLCEIDTDGTLKVDIKCSKSGYVVIYNAVSPSTTWTDKNLGDTRSGETNLGWKGKPNCYAVTANVNKTIDIGSVNKNDKLWIVYLPGSFSGSVWTGVDDGVITDCSVVLTMSD